MEQHSDRILTGNLLEKGSYYILTSFCKCFTLVMPFEYQSLKKIGLFSILIKELCHRFCSWKCSKDANCCSKLTSAQISKNFFEKQVGDFDQLFCIFCIEVTSKYVFASMIFQS